LFQFFTIFLLSVFLFTTFFNDNRAKKGIRLFPPLTAKEAIQSDAEQKLKVNAQDRPTIDPYKEFLDNKEKSHPVVILQHRPY